MADTLLVERRIATAPKTLAHKGSSARAEGDATARPGFVARICARTPADRDRAIDGFRALAILGVIVGHWLVGALTLRGSGVLTITSPLHWLGSLAPASWFLQMLGLFFLVGGYSSALSLSRARERGRSYASWLRARYVRLARPIVAAAAVCLGGVGIASLLGVPEGTVRSWIVLFLQPLWFIGIYLGITALTAYAIRASRAIGLWSAVPLLAVVAAVDFARYGPFGDSVPRWVALVNLLPGWLFAFQIGVAWAERRVSRRGAWTMLAGGVALFALLVTVLGYPTSMVGVPGDGRTNAHPPSLLVLALAAAQSGAAILLHDRVGRLLRRPRIWAGVVVMNLAAMTIFCWHQVPNVVASMVAARVHGSLAGLTNLPDTDSWVLDRLGWMPLFAALLAGIVAVMIRFDQPWTWMPRAARFGGIALAGGFAVAAIALY